MSAFGTLRAFLFFSELYRLGDATARFCARSFGVTLPIAEARTHRISLVSVDSLTRLLLLIGDMTRPHRRLAVNLFHNSAGRSFSCTAVLFNDRPSHAGQRSRKPGLFDHANRAIDYLFGPVYWCRISEGQNQDTGGSRVEKFLNQSFEWVYDKNLTSGIVYCIVV